MTRGLLNASNAVIPTFFQRELLNALVEEGIPHQELLNDLNINHSQFIDVDCRISPSQNIQFIKNALHASKNPHLGWLFGSKIQVTTLGLLGYALMSAGNVTSAIETLTCFFKTREPSFELKMTHEQIDHGSGILEVAEAYDFGEIRYFMLSCIVSAFDHIFELLTREKTNIRKVELTCEEPESWPQQALLINFPVMFGASHTRLYLETAFLDRAMPTANADTEKATKSICQQMLNSIENQSGIVGEVQEFIIRSSGNYPSLIDAADHMCVSPRTLRRELQKSNTTYQSLVDSVRAKIAKKLLLETQKTISQIAFELGYTDTSNFSRAFKSWTGISPGKFRQ